MTKLLQGILSSKGRRAVWERNNAAPPPAPERPPAKRHDPKPGPDGTGTVICCGDTPMSPAAHALHLRGEHLPINCAGVLVASLVDPWLAEADTRLRAERSATPTDDEATTRAEQVAAYYDSQRRRREPRKVSGASDWMAD